MSVDALEAAEDLAEQAKATLKKFEAYVKELHDHLNAKRPEKPPPRFPYVLWDRRDFDPNDGLLTTGAHQLYQAYRIASWRGLAGTAVDHTKSHQRLTMQGATIASPSDPHRHIIDDYENNGGARISAIFAHMHPDVLENVLLGSLSAAAIENPSFGITLRGWCTPQNTPCIYINELVNKEYIFDQQQLYPGRFLNWFEWKELITGIRRYRDEARTIPMTPWVAKVQTQIKSNKPLGNAIDRYLKSENMFRTVTKWLDENEKTFINLGQTIYNQNPNDPRLKIPFRRVPREAGWALYGHQRTSEHVFQKQTNDLWALIQSTSMALFGTDRFEVRSYAIVPMTSPEDAQTAEYLISQISSTYWYQGIGGCNPVLAGTIAMSGSKKAIDLAKYDSIWEESRRVVKDSGILTMSVAHQVADQKIWIEAFDKVNTMSRDAWWDQHEKAKEALRQQIEDLRARMKENVIWASAAVLQAVAQKIKDEKAAKARSQAS